MKVGPCLLSVAVLFSAAVHAAEFSTYGSVYASTGPDPQTRTLAGGTLLYDEVNSDNHNGATAMAAYVASLPSATLKTRVAATADPADVFGNSAFAQVNAVSFADTLTIHIPAGTYQSDLQAVFRGFVTGHLLAQGCTLYATCSNGYQVTDFQVGGGLGAANYHRRTEVFADAVASASLDDFFTLSVPVLRAQTLVEDAQMVLSVTASMITQGSALGTYPNGARRTMFAGDAWGGFTAVETPSGVDWSSNAGFLAQPVPEPESWAMLLAGVVVTGWTLRRRAAHAGPSPCVGLRGAAGDDVGLCCPGWAPCLGASAARIG